MMHEKKLEVYLFFILLAIALYLVFSVFRPYLFAIILAVIFAVIFSPVHHWFLRKMPRHVSLAALLTLLFIVFIVLVPLVFFGVQLSDEIKNLYDYMFRGSENIGFIARLTDTANQLLANFSPFPVSGPVFDAVDTENYILSSLAWARSHVGDIFSGLAKWFVNVFMFLIALYYFIKDGAKFKKEVVEISPFKDERDETIMDKLRLAIQSVVKGSILVS
ncbi:MAG TPA: AI-2E family transporter, partial [Candidatus Paceibacterota bacterium]|nr:AI-2E family transporter [Candidatus Paceibacterota bacterium]